ncbi:MAG: autotransporter outer membrane beta-barrel domain-containing protein, partial [Verrucomicrobiota bacterium]
LGGNGTVGGTLVNAGTLSPGNSPGLINVTGNFSQAAGGKTIIELASLASFDQMVITGTATLNGTLQVTKLPGYTPALGDTFAILTAAGGVSGTFSSLTGTALAATGTAIGSTVSYGATTVTVAFVQLPLAGFALTSNQAAVAGAAQLVPGLVTALDAVPTGQLPAAFNVLSPQGYEVWSNIAFARATALATRLEREDDAVGGLQNAYFEGTERRGHTGGDGDVGRGTFTAYDGLLGDDRVISKSLVVGGLFGYGETTADLGSAGSRTTVRNYTVGLRAVTSRGPWFAHGLLAFGFDRYDATRPIAFTGTSAVASASVHGQQWTAALSGGREIMRGVWRFAPFGGVQATSWQADPFSETGAGALGSTLAGQSALSVRSQFGLEGEAGLRSGTWELFPRFRAAWLHEWDDNSRAIHTAFGAAAYSVRTRAPQRDSALLSVGFDVRLSPRSLIYTDFSAQTGDVTKIVSEFRAGLSVHF